MKSALSALVDRALKQRTALSGVLAMGIKGAGALLTIAVFTLAARAMSADDFGRLAVWFNVMGFLAVAATFGQETLIARSWGEYFGAGKPGLAWGAYLFGWRLTALSGAIFAGALTLIAPAFVAGVAPMALLAVAVCLFTQTLLHYSSHSSRVIVGFVLSEMNREITWRLTLLGAIVWAVLHQGLTLPEFFGAGALGMTLSLCAQLYAVRRKYIEAFARGTRVEAPSATERAAWFSRGRAMWLSAVVEAASAFSDVMLIGYFASPAVAGDYFVAARIANIFLMVNTGLNTYSFTHSAKLYFSGETRKLQDILRSLIGVAAALCLPSLLVVVVFGAQILTIFGERFASVYPTLVVLSCGCFVFAMCGSASVILLTTGHEKLYSRVVLAATALRMALTVALAMRFGALGAAFGWTLVNAPLAMTLAAICRSMCGVDTSLLSVLRRPASAEAQGLAELKSL